MSVLSAHPGGPLSRKLSGAMARARLALRGELASLVMMTRGGDRPKAAHVEFSDESVLPISMWEPWPVFRKPISGRVQDNLRLWVTGGFRCPCADRRFGDVIVSSPTRPAERSIAPLPSLKPQAFMRQRVRGVLPLGTGVVLDPSAGSGSALAAAEAVGYKSISVELYRELLDLARVSIPKLAALNVKEPVQCASKYTPFVLSFAIPFA